MNDNQQKNKDERPRRIELPTWAMNAPSWMVRLLTRRGTALTSKEAREAVKGTSKHARARINPLNWTRDKHKRRKAQKAKRKQSHVKGRSTGRLQSRKKVSRKTKGRLPWRRKASE